jgi:hypothetical protein
MGYGVDIGGSFVVNSLSIEQLLGGPLQVGDLPRDVIGQITA